MWQRIYRLATKLFSLKFIWTFGVLLRIYLTNFPAHYYDIATFASWGNHFTSTGAMKFFATIWTDYLPLPIYLIGQVNNLSLLLGTTFEPTFKLAVSVVELILIFGITKVWPYHNRKMLTTLLLLSPAILGDTSFWGQIDSIPSLLTVLAVLLLIHNPSSIKAGILYGLAVGLKPILLIVAPVIWIITLSRKSWWKFPIYSATTLFCTAFPFVNNPFLAPGLLLARAIEQASTYPYTTVNAWNFWSLFHQSSWVNDTITVLGINAKGIGLLTFFILTFIVIKKWYDNKYNISHILRISGTILVLFYTFTTRMHERHLLFSLPFIYVATAIDLKLIRPALLLTLSFTLNLYSAYYWVFHQQTWPFPTIVTVICSLLTVLVAIYLVYYPYNFPSLINISAKLRKNYILIFVIVLASIARFTNIGYPTSYIFDEVYHAFTSREYLHNNKAAWEWWTTPPEGVAYEWTHPPVAKYGMVMGMILFGENSTGWRIGSALFGVLSIVAVYLLTREITKSPTTALLAAFLISIEGLHIAQSRVAMNDAYMVCFLFWSLYLAVKARWKMAAIFYGLALGSKWSALYGLLPLSILLLRQHLTTNQNFKTIIQLVIKSIRLTLISIIVYILSFTPFILAGHSWEHFVELHRQMWYYHTHLVATHNYQSTPLQWIFSARPVWYFVDYGPNSISHIYAQGNPILLWLGLVALVFQLSRINTFPNIFMFLSYLGFVVPWIFSPRIMFFYHYLPSSMFLSMILASGISHLNKTWKNIVLILCLAGLVLILPVIFGIRMPTSFWNTFFSIFPNWQ